jgi:ribosomal protein S16
MLKIRLQRIGRKNDPHFRLVITPSERKNKTTKFLEILGTYNVKAGEFECKADRVKHWIAMGAQVSYFKRCTRRSQDQRVTKEISYKIKRRSEERDKS